MWGKFGSGRGRLVGVGRKGRRIDERTLEVSFCSEML